MELIALGIIGVVLLAAGIIYASARTHAGKKIGIGLVGLAMVLNAAVTIIAG